MARNLDLLLVNPPLAPEERYGKLAAGGDKMAPLGICYLAASVRKAGLNIEIIDAEAQEMDFQTTADKILKKSPKAVGFTSVAASISNAAKVAKIVKRNDKSIYTILGGPHISSVPLETMQRFPQFDFGIVREGEFSLIELLKNIFHEKKVYDLPGAVIRRKDGIYLSKKTTPIPDLDILPFPAWDLLEGFPEKYSLNIHAFGRTPAASLITSRGCYGGCVFCDKSVFGSQIRFHSSKYIIQMIRHLIKNYGIREISVQDDNILAIDKRITEICAAIIEEGLDISWSCHARVDDADPEILKMLKKAGCWEIAYGFESGSQKILDFLNKATTIKQAEDAVVMTKKEGIRVRGFFMIGNPGETLVDIEKTIEFAVDNSIDAVSVMNFTPFPGTKIFAEIGGYGSIENDWCKMNMYTPIFIPIGLSKSQIIALSKKFLTSFYFRVHIVWEHLRNVKSLKHLMKLIRSAWGVVRF